jgi:hypothetical protein
MQARDCTLRSDAPVLSAVSAANRGRSQTLRAKSHPGTTAILCDELHPGPAGGLMQRYAPVREAMGGFPESMEQDRIIPKRFFYVGCDDGCSENHP